MIGCISCDEFKNNTDLLKDRCQGREWYASDKLIRSKHNIINTTLNNIKFRYTSATIIGPIIIKKDIFHKVGGWSKCFGKPGHCGIGSDWDLSFKCWKNGYHVGISPLDIQIRRHSPEMLEQGDNYILDDNLFYYRYGFRSSVLIDNKSRTSQWENNRIKLKQIIDSYGINFLSIINSKVKDLNHNLK